ncbi:MAG: YigZ family protein [Clostridia bacterium]|nr:YigZ family protein [Clostridia bacterium]
MIDISLKTSYKTVSRLGEAVLTEKKSKFIATAKPVSNEDEAIDFINEVRAKYPDASHNVYAYVIDEYNIYRYSDDGEPQGTAGIPVLDVIRKEGLVDTAVVVTRYFGGTLLGTGGLVRAYGASAKLGIDDAKIVTRTLCDVVSVNVDYSLVGTLQYKIANDNLMLENTKYDSDVTFFICCRQEETDRFIEDVRDITNARAICKLIEKRYIDIA